MFADEIAVRLDASRKRNAPAHHSRTSAAKHSRKETFLKDPFKGQKNPVSIERPSIRRFAEQGCGMVVEGAPRILWQLWTCNLCICAVCGGARRVSRCGQFTRICPNPGGGGGHSFGRVARLATRQRLLYLSSPVVAVSFRNDSCGRAIYAFAPSAVERNASGLRVSVQSSWLLCEVRVLDGPASGKKALRVEISSTAFGVRT